MSDNLEQIKKGKWLAIDADGTKWICTRTPFYNGAKWFVQLKQWNENLEDFMTKFQGANNDKI